MSAGEEPANPDPFIAPLWQDLGVLRSAGFWSEGVRSLSSEDYPTASEMIAMNHRFENGQWTSDAMKAHFAAKGAKEDAVKAQRAAEMADPNYVAF